MTMDLPFTETPRISQFWADLYAAMVDRADPDTRWHDRLTRASFRTAHKYASADLRAMCAAGRLVRFAYRGRDFSFGESTCQLIITFVEQALATRAPDPAETSP